jgi:hypothetical protein
MNVEFFLDSFPKRKKSPNTTPQQTKPIARNNANTTLGPPPHKLYQQPTETTET